MTHKSKQKSALVKKKSTSSSEVSYPWSSVVSSLPSLPGVYWFLDENKSVLYVGKAKNLKNRVGSYTRVKPDRSKTYGLVSKASRLKFRVLDSELEALLTEARLIKLYQPKYNIDLKDDKSPLYIILTNEEFPRVLTARKKQLATTYAELPTRNIFGPFSTTMSARSVIKIGRNVFKFCNATPIDKKNKKACFYTHLNLCAGACVGSVSRVEYLEMLSNLKEFLSGRKKGLLKNLKQEMLLSSTKKDYERAATYRDQVVNLERYYSVKNPLNFDPDLPMLGEDIAAYKSQRLVALLHTKGLVPQSYSIERIEAYDISNTSGNLSTASMVVFIDGKPDTSEYRRFKIKYTTGPNDYAMLQETLERRMNHPEWKYPDLIVIDGGKGQLKSALKVTKDKIPTVSIAKRPDRLMVPQFIGNEIAITSFKLEPGKPISQLIQQLRDEAHRFAKNYHIKLRRKNAILRG